jgi:hypothetical protein
VMPVPAGTTPPGNGSALGAWTVPDAHQGPDPAASRTSNGHPAPPEETGSPAEGSDSEPGSQGGGSR